MSAKTILMIYSLKRIVNCPLLGPNPRKYHVREMEFSVIREKIMFAKMSCPTVHPRPPPPVPAPVCPQYVRDSGRAVPVLRLPARLPGVGPQPVTVLSQPAQPLQLQIRL